jgi:hypothetical protein
MRLPIEFLLRIAKTTQTPDEEFTKMCIIIRPRYAHLEEELLRTFGKQNDVCIILDRRCSDRRKKNQSVTTDRRRVDRRSQKEELVDVVISA